MPVGILGERYARLEVVDLIPEKIGKRHAQIKVRCDCGTVKIIRRGNFRQGRTTSCGCWRKEVILKRGRTRVLPYGRAAANRTFEVYQKDAQRRGYGFSLDFDEFMRLTQLPCAYCGGLPSNCKSNGECNGSFIYNGIDRIDSAQGYIAGNMNPCCRICNRAKSDLPMSEWIKWLERVVARNSI